ncbi:MAG: glycosyltransferase family 4 protein [Sarcina sp.]
MKILVITQYFWPEEFRINDICEGLMGKGHKIDVITGIPNYPYGKFFDGYSTKEKREEVYKEHINIRRVRVVPRKKGLLNLGLNYISYMFWGSLEAMRCLKKDYDKVFVFQLSPITLAIPGIIISKIKKIPSMIYVQDLWPESLYAIKPLNNKFLKRMLDKICSSIYRKFDKVLITSVGFKDILKDKGVAEERIKYFPQWAEDFYSVDSKEIIQGENKEFVLTFAGNVGKAQSVETIIKAANHTKKIRSDLNIKWQIIGDGSEFENVKKLAKEYEIGDILEFLGRKPSNTMPDYFAKSDGLIVTLRDEDILKVTLPAKVQSYMAAKKPILSSVSGEGKRVVEEANCGLTSEAEDYIGLSENAIRLYEMNNEERELLALNGNRYFKENFTRDRLLSELESLLV